MGKQVTKQYSHAGRAGCVSLTKSRDTFRLVGIYHAEQASLDADGGAWSVVCESHGTLVSITTLSGAKECSTLDFCDDCRAECEDPQGEDLNLDANEAYRRRYQICGARTGEVWGLSRLCSFVAHKVRRGLSGMQAGLCAVEGVPSSKGTGRSAETLNRLVEGLLRDDRFMRGYRGMTPSSVATEVDDYIWSRTHHRYYLDWSDHRAAPFNVSVPNPEETEIIEFIRDNRDGFDPHDLHMLEHALMMLEPGQSHSGGGGAAAEWRVLCK
jgi:hypothetical protein